MSDAKNENVRIWELSCKTDPAYTKGFRRSGGFAGTAINPTYLCMRATEMFGPIGKGWGWEIVNEQVVDGVWLDENNREKIHYVCARVWWVEGDQRYFTGPQYGGTYIVYKDIRGIQSDDEAMKKSVTDAVKKCLVSLGFTADVHLGLYDDDKYVAEMERQFGASETNKHGQQRASAPGPQQKGEVQWE